MYETAAEFAKTRLFVTVIRGKNKGRCEKVTALFCIHCIYAVNLKLNKLNLNLKPFIKFFVNVIKTFAR